MPGGISFRDKLNTFRLLQQELASNMAKKRGSFVISLFNPANVLLIIIALLATYGTIDLAIKTNSLWIALITLGLQTIAVGIFFVTDKLDWVSTRLLLFSYIVFYAVVLFVGDGLAIAPYWMFTYILFAFVGAGAKEGFVWIGIHFSMLVLALARDQRLDTSFVDESNISIILIGYILVAAFAYLMDYTSRLITLRLRDQSTMLEEINARYDILLNSVGEGLIAIDEKGMVEFVNMRALKLLGLQRSQVLGAHYADIVVIEKNGERLDRKDHPFHTVLRQKELFETTQAGRDHYEIVADQDKHFSVSMTVSPVRVIGRIQGAIMLFRDASVDEQINKTKNEFVSLASHQLRTPLNVISWYVEKLLNQKRGKLNLHQQQYLEEIGANNHRMITLVADLLTVSRLELGRTTKKHEIVEVHALLDTLIKEVSPLIKQKRIDLLVNHDVHSAELRSSDTNFVTIIIQNLLSNAVKYTPDGGRIQVRLRKTRHNEILDAKRRLIAHTPGYVVSVHDSGIGIPADQQEKIFSKLYRADNAQIVDVGGTGLGLYVSQSFASELGGFIWFLSEVDQGSEFSVFLPSGVA